MASSSAARSAVRQQSYYDGDVDFDILAAKDPDFAAIAKSGKQERRIDFQDPAVAQQLTKSILKCDFGLSIQLPEDRLCPPVPVRWNYIRWIQELLDTTTDSYSDRYDAERQVFGLDIGIGASCIYPLLACSTRPNWRMAGTEIDSYSLTYARRNAEINGLTKHVRLVLTANDGPLVPLDAMGADELDFVMTNPPFYVSKADMQGSYINKQAPPSAVCTGSENEMICPGGEVGFVSRVLEESLLLRERVQWYTAMLGKLPSLHQIVAKFKERGITNFAVTSLQAGYRTNRWAIGWSFQDYRPRNDVARHGHLVHAVLPAPTAQTISLPLMSAQWAGEKVDATIRELDVRWQWKPSISAGVMEAQENVWSRAARRRRKFAEGSSNTLQEPKDAANNGGREESEEGHDHLALAVKITCETEQVQVRWLRGSDYVLFTSFCGVLKNALTSPT